MPVVLLGLHHINSALASAHDVALSEGAYEGDAAMVSGLRLETGGRAFNQFSVPCKSGSMLEERRVDDPMNRRNPRLK